MRKIMILLLQKGLETNKRLNGKTEKDNDKKIKFNYIYEKW